MRAALVPLSGYSQSGPSLRRRGVPDRSDDARR